MELCKIISALAIPKVQSITYQLLNLFSQLALTCDPSLSFITSALAYKYHVHHLKSREET
jgi:hypothetical protein